MTSIRYNSLNTKQNEFISFCHISNLTNKEHTIPQIPSVSYYSRFLTKLPFVCRLRLSILIIFFIAFSHIFFVRILEPFPNVICFYNVICSFNVMIWNENSKMQLWIPCFDAHFEILLLVWGHIWQTKSEHYNFPISNAIV